MEHVPFISTKFAYRRDTKLFAEIEIICMAEKQYKFIIYLTNQKEWATPFERLDSVTLASHLTQVEQTYDKQLDCLRAATRYLSTLRPSNAS